MNAAEFSSLFKGYWPNARNVNAPKQQELWEDTIRGIPDDVVAYSLKRYARQNEYPPTVVKFERFLWPFMDAWAGRNPTRYEAQNWFRRMTKLRDSEHEDDPAEATRRDCRGCLKSIRSGYMGIEGRPYPDGGLVYREIDGVWYAARCPLCGGPDHHRPVKSYGGLATPNALPVPPAEQWEAGEWVPLSRTPGGPLWERVVTERMMSPEHEGFKQFWAWERMTRMATRRKVIETLAERQREWAAANPEEAAELEKQQQVKEAARREQREKDRAEARELMGVPRETGPADREPGSDEEIDLELKLLDSDQVFESGEDEPVPF